ncbi:MAG: hypothetical protein V1743_06050 [Nanoarchaeota archaeon]
MRKTQTIIRIGLAAVLVAVFVYAWASDTDGGFNPFVKGTCSYILPNGTGANLTDFCYSGGNSWLGEYYPEGDGQNQSDRCMLASVYCPGYNHVDGGNCSHNFNCFMGRCKEFIACR